MNSTSKGQGKHSNVKKKPHSRRSTWSDKGERSLKFYRQSRRGGHGHKDRRHPVKMNWNLTVINGTGSGRFHKNTLAPVEANADAGRMRFVGWTAMPSPAFELFDPTSRATQGLTVKADMRAVANFAEHFLLTVNNGSGGGWYRGGAVATITAESPGEGYSFQHWTSTDFASPTFPNASNPLQIPITNDGTVTANFIRVPPAGATYTVLPSGWCPFIAAPVAGWNDVFNRWDFGGKQSWQVGDLACAVTNYGRGYRCIVANTEQNLDAGFQAGYWVRCGDGQYGVNAFPLPDRWPIGTEDNKTMFLTCRVVSESNGVTVQDVTVTVSRHAVANLNATRNGTDARLVAAGAYPTQPGRIASITMQADFLEMTFADVGFPPTGTARQRIFLSDPVTPTDRAAEALAGLYTLQPGQHVTVGNGQGPQD